MKYLMVIIRSILIVFVSCFFCNSLAGQSLLEVEVTNVRSQKGHLLVSIFNSPDHFPKKALKKWRDIRIKKEKIKNNILIFNIDSLPSGKYAIALMDDENDSGEMEYTKLGIPREGFGFSNNAKPILSCPPYKKCQFELKEGKNKITIKTRYK